MVNKFAVQLTGPNRWISKRNSHILPLVNFSLLEQLKKVHVKNEVGTGNKERFDKEQIGVKEPFSETNCQFTS